MARNADFEHGWVVAAAKGNPTGLEFIHAVFDRLEKGAEEYGNESYEGRALMDFHAEAQEEAADVAGWLVLFAQRLRSADIDPSKRDLIDNFIQKAASLGAKQWDLLNEARELVEEALEEKREPAPAAAPVTIYFED